MENSLVTLLKSKKTVFNVKELAVLWRIYNSNTLKSKIYHLVKHGKMKSLHYGIYSIDNDYDSMEFAGKLLHPSYISLETVLRAEGCIFQYSEEVTSVGNLNKTYVCDKKIYSYRKIKDPALYNKNGFNSTNFYTIATKERAFLDMIYLHKDYYFDNLSSLDWNKCFDLVKIYENKALEVRLIKYKNNYAG